MIILRGGPGADGPRPPLKLPSQPPYNGVSRDLRPRLTKERAEGRHRGDPPGRLPRISC